MRPRGGGSHRAGQQGLQAADLLAGVATGVKDALRVADQARGLREAVVSMERCAIGCQLRSLSLPPAGRWAASRSLLQGDVPVDGRIVTLEA